MSKSSQIKHTSRQNLGFTLVELAIVVVIIGLLIGGVIGGKELINKSKLRKVITDLNNYKVATNSFLLEYDCLPGDCANATSYFGTQTATGGCPWTTTVSSQSSPLTCNGNGDGIIWDYSNGGYNTSYEKLRFWQHLSAAQMINADFAGIGDISQSGQSIVWGVGKLGYNQPETSIDDASFSIFHPSTFYTAYTSNVFPIMRTYRNMFVFGSDKHYASGTGLWTASNSGGIHGAGGVLTSREALFIDRKLDDGKPHYGSIVTPPNNMAYQTNNKCTNMSAALTRQFGTIDGWALEYNEPSCSLFINAGF